MADTLDDTKNDIKIDTKTWYFSWYQLILKIINLGFEHA